MGSHRHSGYTRFAWKNGQEIDVLNVPSGRDRYYCGGCKAEKVAVHPMKHPDHRSYFRHYVRPGQTKTPCEWSDETDRHKIAKEILARIKQIKVPSVWKKDPAGKGAQMRVRKKRIIYASRVDTEVYYYEDAQGIIHFQKNLPGSEDCFNLIKPDVIFYDNADKPILFVELVATNKVNNEKRAKIRSLRIDTVQVMIPIESSAKIEKAFYKTKFTKWIYNNDYEHTPYVVPAGSAGPSSTIDGYQRGILEETFSCRSAEIGNFLQRIRRIMARDEYVSAKKELEGEIGAASIALSKVEGELAEQERETARDEGRIKEEVRAEFGRATEKINFEQNGVDKQDQTLERLFNEIGQRNSREKKEIARQEIVEFKHFNIESGKIDGEIQVTEEFLADRNRYIDEEKRNLDISFGRQKDEIESNISAAENNLRRTQLELEQLPSKFNAEEKWVLGAIDQNRAKGERIIRDSEIVIRDEPERIAELRERLESQYERSRTELQNNTERIRIDLIEAVEVRDFDRIAKYSSGIAELLFLRRQIIDLTEKQLAFNRSKRLYESVLQGTYKTWDRYE